MFDFFRKFIFSWKKPRIIIITGKGYETTGEAAFQILKSYFKVRKIQNNTLPLIKNKNEIVILETDLTKIADTKKARFLIENSRQPILVITHISDIPPDRIFFAAEKQEVKEIEKLATVLPDSGFLILNFDDETVRKIKDVSKTYSSSFGFQEGADFQATDIHLNTGVNFKIDYKGNIIPVWLEKLFGKEQIYAALAATGIGKILGINLIKISQELKNYQGLNGKMRLIKGLKKSWILDDTQSATFFSMLEAIEILGKIQRFRRKIAVLGDVLETEKYTVETHEAIGEKIVGNTDLLFTVGSKARFIATAAQIRGFSEEKIFQFDEKESLINALKEKMGEGDLVLIEGSKEIKMKEIVEKIKKI